MRVAGGDTKVASEHFIYRGNNSIAKYEAGGSTFLESLSFAGVEAPIGLPRTASRSATGPTRSAWPRANASLSRATSPRSSRPRPRT